MTTRRSSRIAVALGVALALAWAARAGALTADEVLKLKQAGVSDETIQQMLDNERAQQDAANARAGATQQMQEQSYAADHIGTHELGDGTVVLSTGKADPQQDVFDPTVPNSNANTQPMSVYPYVFPGGPPGPPAPVLGPHGPIGAGPR